MSISIKNIQNALTTRIINSIYDCILDNFILNDPCNPSHPNILFLSITVTDNNNITIVNSNKRINPSCVWSKATDIYIEQYQLCLDNKLSVIDLQNSAYFCKDIHCKCLKHMSEIDSLGHFIIDACVTSGLNCIPLARSSGRDMPGWTEQVKPERDRSLLWHWIWRESGKPRSGVVYDIMRRAKHSYHYAVCSCKKKFETQKQKLLLTWGIVRISGRKLKKNNPTGKSISNSICEANGAKDISKLFLERYRLLYNSVPTDENELNSFRDVIDSNITEQIYYTRYYKKLYR